MRILNMQQQRKNRVIVMSVLTAILITLVCTPIAFANSAEPPSLTVIVPFAPEDLELSIRFDDGSAAESVELPEKMEGREGYAVGLSKETKGWESYYRFFYAGMFGVAKPPAEGAKLIARSDQEQLAFQYPLPASAIEGYNNLFTLNLDAQTLTEGQSPARQGLLIAMRVALTLLLEGVVFFLFGYRQKSSWIAFMVVNLLTQGGLNIMLSGPNMGSYWIFGYAFLEIIIFIVEMIAFAAVLKEHGRRRAALYALTANAVSLAVGGMMLAFLPV